MSIGSSTAAAPTIVNKNTCIMLHREENARRGGKHNMHIPADLGKTSHGHIQMHIYIRQASKPTDRRATDIFRCISTYYSHPNRQTNVYKFGTGPAAAP